MAEISHCSPLASGQSIALPHSFLHPEYLLFFVYSTFQYLQQLPQIWYLIAYYSLHHTTVAHRHYYFRENHLGLLPDISSHHYYPPYYRILFHRQGRCHQYYSQHFLELAEQISLAQLFLMFELFHQLLQFLYVEDGMIITDWVVSAAVLSVALFGSL